MNWAESAVSGAKFVRVWRGDGGRVVRTGSLPPGVDADVRAFIRDRAAFAWANAPESDGTGIDVAGIDAFLAARGLPVTPSVIMRRPAGAAYRAALGGRGYIFPALDSVLDQGSRLHLGVYVREIGMTLSLRLADPGTEPFLHAHLVHEKAHATVFPAEWLAELTGTRDTPGGRVNDWGVRMPRGGFAVLTAAGTSTGEFFEEGFAELTAAEYTRDVLDMPAGLWPDGKPMPARVATGPVPPQLAALPPGYVWQDQREQPYWSSAAFAAAGTELLIRARPPLREALIRARTESSGLRDVARLVSEVHPHLYERLRRAPYSSEGFAAALDDIRAATSAGSL